MIAVKEGNEYGALKRGLWILNSVMGRQCRSVS